MEGSDGRVGDAERWTADARLQHAVGEGRLTLAEYEERVGAVWQARTRGELDASVQDLPAPDTSPAPVRAGQGNGPAPRPRRAVAVMSGDEIVGPVAPGQSVQAYALMGGACVDLRRDDLPAVVRVRAVAVMGGVDVLVPHGVEVHLSGLSLMGGRSLRLDPPRPGAPVVQVSAYAVMGGVDVGHGKQPRRPAGQDAAVPARAAAGRAPGRHRRRGGGRSLAALGLLAVLGGGVALSASSDAAAVFGSARQQVQPGETDVRVGALFGSVRVVVPDGTRVRTGGLVAFGSTDCAACSQGASGGPVVGVTGLGAFGSVEIVTETQDRTGRR